MIRRWRDAFREFERRHGEQIAVVGRARMIVMSALFGMILLLLPVEFALWMMWQGRDMDSWVIHTQEVKTAIESLDKSLSKAIYHQRKYLITGRQSSRDRYREWSAKTWQKLEQLRALTADNPHQQDRCGELEVALAEKFAFMSRTADDRADFGLPRATEDIESGDGEVILDRFDRLIDAADRDEDYLMERRQLVQMRWTVGLWLALGFIFVFSTYMLTVWLRVVWRAGRSGSVPVGTAEMDTIGQIDRPSGV